MQRLTWIALLFLIFPLAVFSQPSQGGTPRSWRVNSQGHYPNFAIKIIEPARLVDEEKEKLRLTQLSDSLKRPISAYGIGVLVRINVMEDAAVNHVEGGSVRMLQITSPGAKKLQVFFDQFKIPAGAELYIYNIERTQTLGAFTHENNNIHNSFGIQEIRGDTIIVEYFQPTNTSFEAKLQIDEIVHAFTKAFHSPVGPGDGAVDRLIDGHQPRPVDNRFRILILSTEPPRMNVDNSTAAPSPLQPPYQE